MLFPLGQVVSTPAVLEAFARNGQTPYEFLERHRNGDWGDLDAFDKRENDYSVKAGLRILSAYFLKDKTKFWIISESDRSSTTLLLPEDY